jgi:hypothetical protein
MSATPPRDDRRERSSATVGYREHDAASGHTIYWCLRCVPLPTRNAHDEVDRAAAIADEAVCESCLMDLESVRVSADLDDAARRESTSAVAFVVASDLRYMTVGSGVLGLPGCRTVRMPRDPQELAEVEFEATAGTVDLRLIAREIERMGARVMAIRGDHG